MILENKKRLYLVLALIIGLVAMSVLVYANNFYVWKNDKTVMLQVVFDTLNMTLP